MLGLNTHSKFALKIRNASEWGKRIDRINRIYLQVRPGSIVSLVTRGELQIGPMVRPEAYHGICVTHWRTPFCFQGGVFKLPGACTSCYFAQLLPFTCCAPIHGFSLRRTDVSFIPQVSNMCLLFWARTTIRFVSSSWRLHEQIA